MWNALESEGIQYYTTDDFVYRANLAIFSFNKTLINHVYSYSQHISLFSQTVKTVLSELSPKCSIVIIENRFSRIDDIRSQLTEFNELLGDDAINIKFIAVFITKPNRFKKPNITIIDILKKLWCDKLDTEFAFDMKKSIMIGANAGRYACDSFTADDSDYDRAFAFNLGIDAFRTPEHIFLASNIVRKWAWKLPDVNRFLQLQSGKEEQSFTELIDANCKKTLIFITGAPASGKSTLMRRIRDFLHSSNIDHAMIDINTSDTGMICEAVDDFNSSEHRVLLVADVLYDDVFAKYLTIIKPSVTVTYLEIEASRDVCRFLDLFRLFRTKSNKLEALKVEEIAKWFIKPRTKKNYINYISFPLVLRTCPDSFYRY